MTFTVLLFAGANGIDTGALQPIDAKKVQNITDTEKRVRLSKVAPRDLWRLVH